MRQIIYLFKFFSICKWRQARRSIDFIKILQFDIKPCDVSNLLIFFFNFNFCQFASINTIILASINILQETFTNSNKLAKGVHSSKENPDQPSTSLMLFLLLKYFSTTPILKDKSIGVAIKSKLEEKRALQRF